MTGGAVPRVAALSAFVMLAAAAVAAAAGPQSSGSSQGQTATSEKGPLVLEPIESGLVLAPEVKITRVDGSPGTFFGGYGGWLFSDTFLLGLGGYSLVNGREDVGMKYGGLVAGVQFPAGDKVRLGVRALLGFGDGRFATDMLMTDPTFAPCVPCVRPVEIHRNFTVFEPQGTAAIRLGRRLSLDLAGGYRMIGSADGWESHFQGGFGSVALRVGPF